MTHQIVIIVLSVILSSTLTFFITTVSKRNNVSVKQMNEYVQNQVQTHLQIKHQKDTVEYVDEQIEHHESVCQIQTCIKKLEKLEKISIWIVCKLGGNPTELEV